MVNVRPIQPFHINMAALEHNSQSVCTHRGDFPLQMVDGSVYYTPMYYNPSASECLLSPDSICTTSNGIFTRRVQTGDTMGNVGVIQFLHPDDTVGISLQLHRRDGLYYTKSSSVAVNHSAHLSQRDDSTVSPSPKSDDAPSLLPPSRVPPFSVPTPKTVSDGLSLRQCQQLEFDLWQARLGHCNEWQLQVLPQAADGTPDKFYPHAFASYDWYNEARICKQPPLKGCHPSSARDKAQRFYMDFGFLRALTLDYTLPDPKRDRVITSFDGYNSYLLVVDDYTKYVWVFLCKSKEPPIQVAEVFLKANGSAALEATFAVTKVANSLIPNSL
jgi:hypothetical protein